jgi:hypothetical protein
MDRKTRRETETECERHVRGHLFFVFFGGGGGLYGGEREIRKGRSWFKKQAP